MPINPLGIQQLELRTDCIHIAEALNEVKDNKLLNTGESTHQEKEVSTLRLNQLILQL